MSDELSAIVRAAARDETAAAEREFPYSSATLGRFVGDVRRRRAAGGTMLAVASVAVVGMAALGLGQLWQTAPPAAFPSPPVTSSASSDPSTTPSPTVEPSTTPTPSPSLTPSASSTPTPTRTSPHTTAARTPSQTPTGPVPGAVTVIRAGGEVSSGMVEVGWDAIADATGYRVYRSDSPGGPFVASASIDVTTGETTVEIKIPYEEIGIDAGPGTYFWYLETIKGRTGYFQVTAFNAAGEGPRSVVICAAPPGGMC